MEQLGGVGVPHYMENLPPVIKKNYGKWKTHEIVKPGVLKHITENGEECYTVRVGMPPARVSTSTMLEMCDLADKYSGGYFRVTQRNSLEFVDVYPKKIDALIDDLDKKGFPVGGTGNSFHNPLACPAWIHCNLPATDSPGIAKALGDAFYTEFKNQQLPAWLKINIAACSNIEEALMGDIGIIGVHRDIPNVIDENMGICERPTVIAQCPTGAIRPKGKYSVEIDPKRCIHCGACTMHCEAILTGDPDTDGFAVAVGGKAGNTGSGPELGRIVIPYIPNNPPEWKEAVEAVTKIVNTWKKDARKWERIREWINRIGWEKFFEKTGIEMTYKHIDSYIYGPEFARTDLRFRW
ncbi:MAG: dissimilatory-type sulfite reductase subunit beta [Candidatus Hydrothermarchaeota archaeon]|nr:dissimilatory-type sulfite reductase subunit beta [Candidatus Hydrothermarchaeota archaeon]